MPSLCCKSKNNSLNFASSNAVNQYAPNTVIEPVHLDICLKLDDLESNILQGKVTLTLRYNKPTLVKSEKERSSLVLNAEEFVNVQVSGEGVSHTYDGHHIQLFWESPFKVDTERKVVVTYIVDDPVAGLYFQKEDPFFKSNPRWAITDHEPEKARYWLPTIDYPAIRTTLTWEITAPSEYVSLANGSLVSEETADGFTTTHWKLDYPCPSYLVCFSVGDFVCVDDGEVQGIPIKYYAAKGADPADISRSFDQTPAMIKWLQERVGVTFPWTKYYQIALPAIRGAMENISLVTWADRYILDKVNAQERKYMTDLVNIHEMAHTYFGDLLVIRHFEHAWLKESWATYIESWLEDHLSNDNFSYEMLQNQIHYFKECEKYMRPIVTRKYDSSWDMFDMHTYPGGAWRIHMLRKRLGDEAFWAAIKLYIETFSEKTVQTSDFQTALETTSGLNLTRFFDEWIYSKGYPKIKGKYSYEKLTGLVKIVLTQTQENEANNNNNNNNNSNNNSNGNNGSGGVPLFAFDLDIQISDNKGNVHHTTACFDRENTVTVFVQLDKENSPETLRVDPEGKILFAFEMPVDQEVLVNTAKSSKDVLNRIWAYRELIKSESKIALKKVQEIIKDEPFYGVRIQVANNLSSLQSHLSIKILTEILDREQDPLALSSILNACQFKDVRVRESVLRFLSRDYTLPYRAHASALLVLAIQHNPEDISLLLDVAQDQTKIGQYSLVRGGALEALGYHRSLQGFEYLINHVEYGTEPTRARPLAIEGLAYSAQWQEERHKKRAEEVIVSLLRDPDPNVRAQAVSSTIGLSIKSAHTTMESIRYMYSKDDQTWLDRRLSELIHSGSSTAPQCSKEYIEKLEERIKKLEARLEDKDDAQKTE
ncbi:peptidase family M1-domain-containing protein [Phycomyces blakesleeanus]|uniref:Peptidase family M1-domain-containing protein n=1 Tax=Phycomyces blakesleeanus TaxID=4837 RepID=A0ABR3ASA2_PHYBL